MTFIFYFLYRNRSCSRGSAGTEFASAYVKCNAPSTENYYNPWSPGGFLFVNSIVDTEKTVLAVQEIACTVSLIVRVQPMRKNVVLLDRASRRCKFNARTDIRATYPLSSITSVWSTRGRMPAIPFGHLIREIIDDDNDRYNRSSHRGIAQRRMTEIRRSVLNPKKIIDPGSI